MTEKNRKALEHADTLRYPSSMRSLVDKDIREALRVMSE